MSEAAGKDLAEPLASKTSAGKEACAERSARTCLACGAIEEPGKKLLRCSGCLSVCFCNVNCQKSAWKQHKADCIRCKKVDVYAASPLLAAVAFIPRMHIPVKMLSYEVSRRELRSRELHLYLRNQGRMRFSPAEFDKSGPIHEGPSREQLHNMVQHDGYLEATVVGSLYGFHYAVQQYNNRGGHGAQQNALDYVTLVHRKAKITEYGIAVGSTCPDYTLVYHVGDKVRQLQDPNNHVWMYFRTERSDRLYLDVGSLPFGMGLMLNIVDYLPDGTPESRIRSFTPTLGAPGHVMDLSDPVTMERIKAGSADQPKKTYLADRQRIPVSSAPVDVDPEDAIRGLLQQLRQAVAAPPSAAAKTTAVMGMLAAAAVVTAAAVAVRTEATGGGGGEEGSPSCIRGGSGGGGGGSDGAARGSNVGSSAKRRIPFRDSSRDKHVKRGMLHFNSAFNNTYAVLEQATYIRYPPSLDGARSFASWVNLPAMGLPARRVR